VSLAAIADRLAQRIGPGTSRRSFLGRTAMVGTALAVAPKTFILRPVDAYASVCHTPSTCPRGSLCSPQGYTEFCCTMYGANACPPGTIAAGWWRADGSGFCGPGGPRYYLDCNAGCGACGCGASGVCGGACSGTVCTCGNCSCSNWKAGCALFRYGQCNQEVRCVGPIVCRVVTCTPPWIIDATCTQTVAVDNNTRFHDRPCLHQPAGPPQATDGDVWVTARDGAVYALGRAPYLGGANTLPLNRPIVGMASTPSSQGYWLVASDGGVFAYGDAGFHGSTGAMRLNRPVVGMAPTPSGQGYWLVASDGGVFAYGDAGFHGSTGAMTLNRPVVGMAPTPSGQGYWLVASDGGVFAFGDAGFHGSGVGRGFAAPFAGIAAAGPAGYWLAAADGWVLAFGTTPLGDAGPPRLTSSITAIAATRTRQGYYLIGGDGSLFPAGDAGTTPNGPLPVRHTAVAGASFR
jgi:hypothetical protein